MGDVSFLAVTPPRPFLAVSPPVERPGEADLSEPAPARPARSIAEIPFQRALIVSDTSEPEIDTAIFEAAEARVASGPILLRYNRGEPGRKGRSTTYRFEAFRRR